MEQKSQSVAGEENSSEAGTVEKKDEQSTKTSSESIFRDMTKENNGKGILLMGEVVARQWKALAQRRNASDNNWAPGTPEQVKKHGVCNPLEGPDEMPEATPEEESAYKELVGRQPKKPV